MCFAVPYEIMAVDRQTALTEGGRKIYLGRLKGRKGDYVRCVGEAAVDVLSKKDGRAIRRLIASLNA